MRTLNLLFAFTAITALVSNIAIAVDQNIPTKAEFRQALSFGAATALDFTPGNTYIEVSGVPTSADTITMAMTGNISYVGTHFAGPATGGQPGSITFTGSQTTAATITCTATATMATPTGSDTLPVSGLNIKVNNGTTNTTLNCGGLTGTVAAGTAASFTIGATNTVTMVGSFAGDGGAIQAVEYSTANTGGAPATIRVVYS